MISSTEYDDKCQRYIFNILTYFMRLKDASRLPKSKSESRRMAKLQIYIFLTLTLCGSTVAVLSNEERDAWISHYFRMGHTRLDICGFLLFVHSTVVSVSQVKRILRRLGLKRQNASSPLPEVIRAIRTLYERGFGDCGYRTIWKMANTIGNVTVTQETTRLVMKVLDPLGVSLRAQHRLRRRTYTNKGPNFSVHIDGYDKLKPYGVSIHGAIDGFSRHILWLEACYTNNDPRIVAGFYLDFVKRVGGVPRLVRGDAGTENVWIRAMHIAFRFTHTDSMAGRNSYVTGRSTNNQRIERFWCNLRLGFTSFWRNFFKDMADRGLLRIDDPVHLECLRFCFLPLIQNDLNNFVKLWNLHRIRQQRHTEVPCGIPVVMYNQPEAYGTRDYLFPLPCDTETITYIQERYTLRKPKFGCKDDFLPVLEHLCGMRRERLPIPETLESATSLFQVLIEYLDDF